MPNTKPIIIFEDDDLLVLDKPARMTVHEGVKVSGPTLVDFLAGYLKKSPLKEERYGLLHRLDRDTSGIILVAKTKKAFDFLKGVFKNHKIQKEYLALVSGKVSPHEGIIRLPLARSPKSRTSFAPHRTGRPAETEYKTLDNPRGYSYLAVYPKTGRTHQIRVHLQSLGHPIVGDTMYGKGTVDLTRHFLHAHKIKFTDWDNQVREFTSPLPSDLKKFLHDHP